MHRINHVSGSHRSGSVQLYNSIASDSGIGQNLEDMNYGASAKSRSIDELSEISYRILPRYDKFAAARTDGGAESDKADTLRRGTSMRQPTTRTVRVARAQNVARSFDTPQPFNSEEFINSKTGTCGGGGGIQHMSSSAIEYGEQSLKREPDDYHERCKTLPQLQRLRREEKAEQTVGVARAGSTASLPRAGSTGSMLSSSFWALTKYFTGLGGESSGKSSESGGSRNSVEASEFRDGVLLESHTSSLESLGEARRRGSEGKMREARGVVHTQSTASKTRVSVDEQEGGGRLRNECKWEIRSSGLSAIYIYGNVLNIFTYNRICVYCFLEGNNFVEIN